MAKSEKQASLKVKLTSMDIAEEKRAQLKALFPDAFAENKLDFDQLKRALGEWVEPTKERFGLNWPGKAECMKVIQQPSVATLKPVRNESVNFDTTENLFIEGDNLEVLKLLQKSYFGKVKMIYIDPPYNTGNEFIYPDKFSETLDTYLEYTGQKDGNGHKFSTNTDTNGRYHSKWLNMMYPRLYLAKNLLRDDGVIFISIDDNEQSNLKALCDLVFGEENFVGCAARIAKKSNNKGEFWAPNFDYILTYTKLKSAAKPFFGGVNTEAYNQIESEGPRTGERYQLVRLYMSSIQNRNPEQRFFLDCPDGSKIIPPGSTFPPERPVLGDGIWRWTKKKIEKENNRIVIKSVKSSNLIDENGNPAKWNVYTKTYLKDVIEEASAKPNSLIEKQINQIGSHELNKMDIPFNYSKPASLIKYLLEISRVNADDIILDFFAGSATTAHAVMQLNKEDGGNHKYIMVQLPEPCDENSEACKAGYKTIADIGKERIRRAAQKIAEEQGSLADVDEQLDLGFKVFKLTRSNFKVWEGDVEKIKNLEQQLLDYVDHINAASTPEDILYELLLKSGFPLTTQVKTLRLAGKDVFSIEAGTLLICLDKALNQAVIDAIANKNPRQVIFLDAGFKGDDQLKANAVQTFKTRAQQKESEIVFRTV